MEEETYTISYISRRQVPIGGSGRSYEFIQKLIRNYNIESPRNGMTGAPEYRVSDIENAYQLYNQVENADADAYQKEKYRKILLENEHQELINENLKKNLIGIDEVITFWTERKAIELALLRRLFIIEIPMHIPGLSHADARTKGEIYYNKFLQACEESSKLWEEEYQVKADDERINQIREIILYIESTPISGSIQSDSGNSQENSGSANPPVV